jgi:DNA invertase Pin-like site-specific DNA recombinase
MLLRASLKAIQKTPSPTAMARARKYRVSGGSIGSYNNQLFFVRILLSFEGQFTEGHPMQAKPTKVAMYTRVSTEKQTTENQLAELKSWATRAGHTIGEVFEDKGISGSKGRDKRPAFDQMLKAAVRREFGMVAVWSSDRLGRSLQDLIEVLQTIRQTGVGLYIHTQSLDTTTPSGRAMFGMLGVFAEFEREMIVARVNAGLARAKAAGTKLGRPKIDEETAERLRAELAKGTGVGKAARIVGVGTGTAQRIKREMVEAEGLMLG